MNESYPALLDNGPLPADDLTQPMTHENRALGVTTFNPRGSHGSETGSGPTNTVYYIEDEHDPRMVVRTWLGCNPMVAENLSNWTLHNRISTYGDEFREASKAILGEVQTEAMKQGGTHHDSSGECPMCGEEYAQALADHLPGCEG